MFSKAYVKNSVYVREGCVHPLGRHPSGRQPPPHQTATAADGMHPTGMLCFLFISGVDGAQIFTGSYPSFYFYLKYARHWWRFHAVLCKTGLYLTALTALFTKPPAPQLPAIHCRTVNNGASRNDPQSSFKFMDIQELYQSNYLMAMNHEARGFVNSAVNSTIHKASGFMVHGCSTGLPGIIPVEQKSVHWLSMGAASRNDLQRSFCTVAGHMAAL